MSKLDQYAENQRQTYSKIAQNLENAKDAVGPNYEQLRRAAKAYAEYVLGHYFLRNGISEGNRRDTLKQLRLLDFGCGVGRVMEAFSELGIPAVDGCDISEEMLGFARASKRLTESNFFLSSGHNAGDAPAGHYDIAYSFLCFHHIPMRQTRVKLFESICQALKPGGMIFIEFKVFPGATAARIPANHAHWNENRPARETNSAADVWVTPDSLGEVVEDFRLFFNDIATQEVDLGIDLYEYDPDEIYQLGFNELFLIATKGAGLRTSMLRSAGIT